MSKELKKREWVYLLHPTKFEMRCDKCWDGDLKSDTGKNIDWSEYQGMIWCYDCQIDTKGVQGIFSGPIPINTCYILGLNFDRFNLKTNEVELLNLDTLNSKGVLEWDNPKKVTKNKLKNHYDYGKGMTNWMLKATK